MKSEHQKNSFKDGLDSIQDHSASMGEGWSALEQRLENHDAHRRRMFWYKTLAAAAVLALLVFAWFLFQPAEVKNPEQEVVKNERPQQEIQEPVRKETPKVNKQSAEVPRSKHGYKYIQPESELLKLDSRLAIKRLGHIDSGSRLGITLARLDITVPLNVVPEKPAPLTALKPSSSRLSLTVIYGPALNGVSNFSKARVGHDVGLMLNIGLSGKWTLSTGAIYAKKPYESDFSQYNPINKDIIPYPPESILADCRVLDIPLNLNYTLLDSGKNKVSLGTGLSSYLMLKENYQLRYYKSDGLPDYNYTIRNQNKHLLSVLNVEARYEHRINSKIAIGLQPYLKMPLSDIGYGHVKLQSLGMAVNLNLNLSGNPKKNK